MFNTQHRNTDQLRFFLAELVRQTTINRYRPPKLLSFVWTYVEHSSVRSIPPATKKKKTKEKRIPNNELYKGGLNVGRGKGEGKKVKLNSARGFAPPTITALSERQTRSVLEYLLLVASSEPIDLDCHVRTFLLPLLNSEVQHTWIRTVLADFQGYIPLDVAFTGSCAAGVVHMCKNQLRPFGRYHMLDHLGLSVWGGRSILFSIVSSGCVLLHCYIGGIGG